LHFIKITVTKTANQPKFTLFHTKTRKNETKSESLIPPLQKKDYISEKPTDHGPLKIVAKPLTQQRPQSQQFTEK